jgi:membrane protein implicated in regulation of membrane protease activity
MRRCYRRRRPSPLRIAFGTAVIVVVAFSELGVIAWVLLGIALAVLVARAVNRRQRTPVDAPATPQGWRTHDVSLID